MKELQYYNIEHQKQVLDPEYVPQCAFSCDIPALVMDYYKDGLNAGKPAEYFDPEAATKTLMEFTNGQAIPSALYNQAIWTNHYLETLVTLLHKGFDCNPEIMLKLVNQYDKVMKLLSDEKEKAERFHKTIQRLRSKNFELRKTIRKAERKITALQSSSLSEDDGSLSASMDFGE